VRRCLITVVLAVGALVGGCALPNATTSPSAARDLNGTWHGYLFQPGGSLYTVEARCVLRINGDGTFTATVTPVPVANNLAKTSSWSGTVVGNASRVTFRTAQGPWVTLARSDDRLYGVANDPATGMTVMINLERAGGQ